MPKKLGCTFYPLYCWNLRLWPCGDFFKVWRSNIDEGCFWVPLDCLFTCNSFVTKYNFILDFIFLLSCSIYKLLFNYEYIIRIKIIYLLYSWILTCEVCMIDFAQDKCVCMWEFVLLRLCGYNSELIHISLFKITQEII